MSALVDVKVPDIGDFHDVDVVEVMVKPGDHVGVDDSLITIESEKASMEVPSPQAGTVKEIKVKIGDKVSEGSPIVVIEPDTAGAAAEKPAPAEAKPEPARAMPAIVKEEKPSPPREERPAPKIVKAPEPPAPRPAAEPARALAEVIPIQSAAAPDGSPITGKPHASPSVRKLARELGVDLGKVKGSGLHGRIFRGDVQHFVRASMTAARPTSAAVPLDLAAWPKVDFTKYGEIETRALSRIRKASRTNLARNWVMIPHVTQFDEADVTELEEFRNQLNASQGKSGIRVTLLSFILKALVASLTEFPEFNSSLEGDTLILKKYFHFGFAADTPEGLVVPVIRDVDKKGVLEIAQETAALATSARAGKLKPLEIQGGCITVSSLGGIGGTAFTPIINAPEVAVLGVSRVTRKPVWENGTFVPRLILPLSLSYDHRVIDGATAARFTTYLATVLADMRRALL
jgi:pyruvate dehydrogenase E2 component (dihydrolipoamide acetyltransferase)